MGRTIIEVIIDNGEVRKGHTECVATIHSFHGSWTLFIPKVLWMAHLIIYTSYECFNATSRQGMGGDSG